MKSLLTGNEALARGAWEAGVTFSSSYPGTPSTEITENLATYPEIIAEWAPNEKVGLEAAIGASIGGVRSLSAMKHVGLNVAADGLFTYAYTGVNAGLVVITADEPGQHSSQNEQDNRHYAVAAKVPMLEPSDSQECKDMIKLAYQLSEEYDTPVLMRLTTRVNHSKSLVELQDRVEFKAKEYVKDVSKYLMVPANAVKRRAVVEQRLATLKEYAEKTPLNRIEEGGKIGIVASGAAYEYAKEVFEDQASYLKLGFTNPLPDQLLKEFASKVETLYVIEEDDPYLENWIKANGIAVHGKDTFPAYGEMTPDVIRKALNMGGDDFIEPDSEKVVPRPPTLCPGCPHRGIFYDLGKRKDIAISGDIGCYTLGFAHPYNAMDTCIDMGGAFSIGHGMKKAFDISQQNKKVVSIIGDSTFFHTGINALTEVMYNQSNTVNVILDNRITAMTDQQENPGSGYNARGQEAQLIQIEPIVKALGFKHIYNINPNELDAVKKTFDEALALDEPAVIITTWPCALKKLDEHEYEQFHHPFTTVYQVDADTCISCRKCLQSGCPAISMDPNTNKAIIDEVQCVGCDVCAQICPVKAIAQKGGK